MMRTLLLLLEISTIIKIIITDNTLQTSAVTCDRYSDISADNETN